MTKTPNIFIPNYLIDLSVEIQNLLITPLIIFGKPDILVDIYMKTSRFTQRIYVIPFLSTIILFYMYLGIHKTHKVHFYPKIENSFQTVHNEFRTFHLWERHQGNDFSFIEVQKWVPKEPTWEARSNGLPSNLFYSSLNVFQKEWNEFATARDFQTLEESTETALVHVTPQEIPLRLTEGLIFAFTSPNDERCPNLLQPMDDPQSKNRLQLGDQTPAGFNVREEWKNEWRYGIADLVYDENFMKKFFKKYGTNLSHLKLQPLHLLGDSAVNLTEHKKSSARLKHAHFEHNLDKDPIQDLTQKANFGETKNLSTDTLKRAEIQTFLNKSDTILDLLLSNDPLVTTDDGENLIDYVESCADFESFEDFDEFIDPDEEVEEIIDEENYRTGKPQFLPLDEEYPPIRIAKPIDFTKQEDALWVANSTFCVTPFPEQVFFFRKFQGKVYLDETRSQEGYFGRLVYLRDPVNLIWPHSQQNILELLHGSIAEDFENELYELEEEGGDAELELEMASLLDLFTGSNILETDEHVLDDIELSQTAKEANDASYIVKKRRFSQTGSPQHVIFNEAVKEGLEQLTERNKSLQYYLKFLFEKSTLELKDFSQTSKEQTNEQPFSFSFQFDEKGEEEFTVENELEDWTDQIELYDPVYFERNWNTIWDKPNDSPPNLILLNPTFNVNHNFSIYQPKVEGAGQLENPEALSIFLNPPFVPFIRAKKIKEEEEDPDKDLTEQEKKETDRQKTSKEREKELKEKEKKEREKQKQEREEEKEDDLPTRVRCTHQVYVVPKSQETELQPTEHWMNTYRGKDWAFLNKLNPESSRPLEVLLEIDSQEDEFQMFNDTIRDFSLMDLYDMRKVKHQFDAQLKQTFNRNKELQQGILKSFQEGKNESYPYKKSQKILIQSIQEFIDSYVGDPQTEKRQPENTLDPFYKPLFQSSSWSTKFLNAEGINHSQANDIEIKSINNEKTSSFVELPVVKKYFYSEMLFFQPVEPWQYFLAALLFSSITPFFFPVTRIMASIVRFIKRIEEEPFKALSSHSPVEIVPPFPYNPLFSQLRFVGLDVDLFGSYFRRFKIYADARHFFRFASVTAVLGSCLLGISVEGLALASFLYLFSYQSQNLGAIPYVTLCQKSFQNFYTTTRQKLERPLFTSQDPLEMIWGPPEIGEMRLFGNENQQKELLTQILSVTQKIKVQLIETVSNRQAITQNIKIQLIETLLNREKLKEQLVRIISRIFRLRQDLHYIQTKINDAVCAKLSLTFETRYPLPTSFLVLGGSGTGKSIFFNALVTHLGVIGISCRVQSFQDVRELMSLTIFRPCILHFDHIENISMVRQKLLRSHLENKLVKVKEKYPKRPYQIEAINSHPYTIDHALLVILKQFRQGILENKLSHNRFLQKKSVQRSERANFRRLLTTSDRFKRTSETQKQDKELFTKLLKQNIYHKIELQNQSDYETSNQITQCLDSLQYMLTSTYQSSKNSFEVQLPSRYDRLAGCSNMLLPQLQKSFSQSQARKAIRGQLAPWISLHTPLKTRPYDLQRISSKIGNKFENMLDRTLSIMYEPTSAVNLKKLKKKRRKKNLVDMYLINQNTVRGRQDHLKTIGQTYGTTPTRIYRDVRKSPDWVTLKDDINLKSQTAIQNKTIGVPWEQRSNYQSKLYQRQRTCLVHARFIDGRLKKGLARQQEGVHEAKWFQMPPWGLLLRSALGKQMLQPTFRDALRRSSFFFYASTNQLPLNITFKPTKEIFRKNLSPLRLLIRSNKKLQGRRVQVVPSLLSPTEITTKDCTYPNLVLEQLMIQQNQSFEKRIFSIFQNFKSFSSKQKVLNKPFQSFNIENSVELVNQRKFVKKRLVYQVTNEVQPEQQSLVSFNQLLKRNKFGSISKFSQKFKVQFARKEFMQAKGTKAMSYKLRELISLENILVSKHLFFEACSTFHTKFPYYLRVRGLLAELLIEKSILSEPPLYKYKAESAGARLVLPPKYLTGEELIRKGDPKSDLQTSAKGGGGTAGIGKSSGGSGLSLEQALLALLTALDGSIDSTILVASAPSLDSLDIALRRTGRFDNKVQLKFPRGMDRVQILKLHGTNHPFCNFSPDISWGLFQHLTSGWNPNDIGFIINHSLFYAYLINLPDEFLIETTNISSTKQFIYEERLRIFEKLSENEKKSMKKLEGVKALYAKYPTHTMETLILGFLVRYKSRETLKKYLVDFDNPDAL